jgi:predicted phosphodiesterase/biotin operon repressor
MRFVWSKELDDLIIDLYDKQKLSTSKIEKYLKEQKSIELSKRAIESQIYRLRKKGKITKYGLNVSSNKLISKLDNTEDILYKLLKKGSLSIGELSRKLDRSKESIIEIIDKLRFKGFDINYDEAEKRATLEREYKTEFKPLKLGLVKNYIKIGCVSDTHFGSKMQNPSLLYTIYKQFEQENIDFAVHAGDITEGINMYRGQEHERFLHGADEMKDYTIDIYPKTNKFKTYMIGGSHDMSFKKAAGYNIVRSICEKRDDLVYRGEENAIFNIKNCNIKLMHPTSGVPYALTYRPQKIIESVTAEMIMRIRENKDINILLNILFFGHYHVASYLPSYFGVEGIGVPCLQKQTPYLTRKGLTPIIGYVIVEVWLNKEGNIVKSKPDFRYLGDKAKENDY